MTKFPRKLSGCELNPDNGRNVKDMNCKLSESQKDVKDIVSKKKKNKQTIWLINDLKGGCSLPALPWLV